MFVLFLVQVNRVLLPLKQQCRVHLHILLNGTSTIKQWNVSVKNTVSTQQNVKPNKVLNQKGDMQEVE